VTDPDVTAWALRLAPQLGSVLRLYLPGAPFDARRRELLATVVSGARGVPVLADLHTGWLEVLGPAELDDVDDEVFAWAARAAVLPWPEAGEAPDLPVDDAVRQALSAAVAHGVVVALTVQRGQSAVDRLLGRRPFSLKGLGSDVMGFVVGAPVAVPLAAAAGAVSVLGRVVPAPATLVVDSDPNLLTQLLADALPAWLGGVWGRLLVSMLPVEVPVAWQSGRSGSTVRVGRGRVQVENGLAPDAWAMFDGDVDSLVRAGSRTLAREVRAAHARP
jgi:hypothetical protein